MRKRAKTFHATPSISEREPDICGGVRRDGYCVWLGLGPGPGAGCRDRKGGRKGGKGRKGGRKGEEGKEMGGAPLLHSADGYIVVLELGLAEANVADGAIIERCDKFRVRGLYKESAPPQRPVHFHMLPEYEKQME